MHTSTILPALVVGVLSIGCAATEYQRSSLPEGSGSAPRLELTVDDASAAPSFPARITEPSAPAAADRLAARLVADQGGRARTDVRLCVAGDGAVADVSLVRSSGIDSLDDALIAEARTWRYQPLALASATVCQDVAIAYNVR